MTSHHCCNQNFPIFVFSLLSSAKTLFTLYKVLYTSLANHLTLIKSLPNNESQDFTIVCIQLVIISWIIRSYMVAVSII